MVRDGDAGKVPEIGGADRTSGVRPSQEHGAEIAAAASPAALRPGDCLLEGRFRIQRRLGEGGMGIVYEAFDASLQIPVALKTLSRLDAAGVYRLKNEFRSVASLVHENLVRLYELYADGARWFFTMSLIDGVPFTEHVRQDAEIGFHRTVEARAAGDAAIDETLRGGVLATGRSTGAVRERTLRRALGELALGVHAIHRAGMLHRDLKPSNVLVTRAGRVMILDFGLVSSHGVEAVGQTVLDEGLSGTPAYMSPEQARGERATTASDWYAVGVMLFQALTGELPFDGSAFEVMQQKLSTDAPASSSRFANIPEDLDRLCVELLRQRPEERPGGAELLARLGVAREAPSALPSSPSSAAPADPASRGAIFVGREAELRLLGDCLRATDEGAPVVALVAGPSGMGKTALVERFLEQTRGAESVIVLSSRCYEREAMPYKAFDGVIDALSRLFRRIGRSEAEKLVPRNVQALVRLFPVLERVEVIASARQRAPLPVDPQELRRRGVGALKEILSRLADGARVIVAIDDLQWGDLDSVKLLRELCAPPDPPAIVVLGTYRDDEANQNPILKELFNPERGLRDVQIRKLKLEPLSEAEVSALARAVGGDGLDVASIQREARGSPYIARELVRYARAGAAAPGKLTLDDALRARLSALPGAAERLLVAFAVAGHPLDRATAARSAGLELAAAADAIEALRAAALIRGVAAAGEAATSRFTTYHDRIREALVAGLADVERRRWHRSLATALETADHADTEALSHHYLESGDLARAGKFALEAARHASDILAFERAAMLYRIALDHGVEDSERAALLVQLGEALINAGRNADAARAFLDAAKLSDESTRQKLTSRAGVNVVLAGHIDEGRPILDEVLKGYGIVIPEDPMLQVQKAWELSEELQHRGLAFRERREQDIPRSELERLDTLTAVTLGMSSTGKAGVHMNRLVLDALELGEPMRVVRALGLWCGMLACLPDLWPFAERSIEVMSSLTRRLGSSEAEAWLELARGGLYFCQGRSREATDHLLRADVLWSERCVGVARQQATTRTYLVNALIGCGRIADACQRIHRWSKEADDRNDLFLAVRCRSTNIAWLPFDEPERARSELDVALTRWGRTEFDIVVWGNRNALAGVELYAGAGQRAWDVASKNCEVFVRQPMSLIPVFRHYAFAVRGASAIGAAAQTADPEPFLRAAADCAAELASLDVLPPAEPGAELLRAGIAELRGQTDAAIEHYTRAGALLEPLNPVNAAIAAARRGRLLGGSEGRALVARAQAVLTAQGIKNPERWMRMTTPAALRD